MEADPQSSGIPPVGSGRRHDMPKGVIEDGERRTWASWVIRRTNRGQRTRRDSRTECPVWKTSPNSRASGATNAHDHRAAGVTVALKSHTVGGSACIVLLCCRLSRLQPRMLATRDNDVIVAVRA